MLWFALFLLAVTSSATATDDDSSCSLLEIPTVTLHNGVAMPILQLGTAQLIETPQPGSNFVGMLPERGFRQLDQALSVGVRAFDSAYIYRSQPVLGHVLGEWFRDGRLTRQEVFVVSKVHHPYAEPCFGISHMPDWDDMTHEEIGVRTRQHFEESLKELHFGYVDLMLLHWPGSEGGTVESNRQKRLAAWKVLEIMYQKGFARAIGVSNFSSVHLEQLKEDGAEIVPMVNQFEASIFLQYPQILEYCQKHNIVPQAYSPLRGRSEFPSVVHELARKYDKDVGQITFRYLLQLGYAIVYMTNTESRMISNTQVFDFELSATEMQQLKALARSDTSWGLPSPHDLL